MPEGTFEVRVAAIRVSLKEVTITDHQGTTITLPYKRTPDGKVTGTVPIDAQDTWVSLRNKRCNFVIAPMPKWW